MESETRRTVNVKPREILEALGLKGKLITFNTPTRGIKGKTLEERYLKIVLEIEKQTEEKEEKKERQDKKERIEKAEKTK